MKNQKLEMANISTGSMTFGECNHPSEHEDNNSINSFNSMIIVEPYKAYKGI
jgi:hypothetical protein